MRKYIYFVWVTYAVSAMCNNGKSCAKAVEDNDHSKHTATRPFGVMTITFITADLDEKCLHQNNIDFSIKIGRFCLLCSTLIPVSKSTIGCCWMDMWRNMTSPMLCGNTKPLAILGHEPLNTLSEYNTIRLKYGHKFNIIVLGQPYSGC